MKPHVMQNKVQYKDILKTKYNKMIWGQGTSLNMYKINILKRELRRMLQLPSTMRIEELQVHPYDWYEKSTPGYFIPKLNIIFPQTIISGLTVF